MEECVPKELRVRVPTYEDVRKRVLQEFPKPVVVPRGIRRLGRERAMVYRYVVKCERVFQIIAEELGRVARMPRTDAMHPFYAELVRAALGEEYDKLVENARRCVKVVSRLWKDYRSKILSCYSGSEAKNLAREFVGRALSSVKRALRNVDKVIAALAELRKLPCIDPEQPTMIVAGMPQVGKSTLVSTLSSAKPEVAPYPFTTKTIIAGHMDLGPTKLQIIDTPGILDRPIEEMNPIERRAIAALTTLRAIVVFLMDPSPDSYYSFDRQLRTLKSVSQLVGEDRLLVVFNKVDKVSRDRIDECRKAVESLGLRVDLEISALYGYNLDKLVQLVLNRLGMEYPTPAPR